jgi:hypothetical protein
MLSLSDSLANTVSSVPLPELGRRLGILSLLIAHGGGEAQAAAALTVTPLPDTSDPAGWRKVREAELHRLGERSAEELLGPACEALFDITQLLSDLRYRGITTWDRYPVPRLEIGWWYKSLLPVFYARMSGPRYQALLAEYANRVRALNEIVFEGNS